ncbi:MAG: oligosaccharide flippase family protein [Polyangiales bacterium]
MSGLALTSRTALVATGQALIRLSQLVVVALLVRALSPASFDNLNLLLSVYMAAIAVGSLSLQQTVYFFYARLPREGRRAFAVQTATVLTGTGLLTAAVVFAVGPLISGGHFEVEGPLRWLSLALLLEMPSLAAPELLLAAEKPRASVAFNAVASVLQALAILVPAWLGLPLATVSQALAGYAALRLVAFVALVLPGLPHGTFALTRAAIKEQLWFAAPLGLAMATSTLNKQIDKWLIAWLLPGDYGTYVVAAQEIPLITVLPYAIGSVVATRFAHAFREDDVERARGYFVAIVSRVSLAVLPATCALILVAPEAVPWFATAAHADAVLPFSLYSVILLHRVAEYGVVLRAAGRSAALWAASACLLIANLGFSLPLVWLLGSVGAALGTLFANGVSWIFALSKIADAMRTDLRGVFPWRHYASVLAIAVAAAGISGLVVGAFTLPAATRAALKLALFMLLYLLGMRITRLTRRLPAVPNDSDGFQRDLAGPSVAP